MSPSDASDATGPVNPAPATCPTCPTCAAALPPDAPVVDGRPACPRCLLGAGIPTGRRYLEPPSAAEVAAAFPDYEILGLLGRGGMGVVWKARQRSLDRVVALKVLPRDAAAHAGSSRPETLAVSQPGPPGPGILPESQSGPPGPGTLPGSKFTDRFQREARALARLAHPNIVGVHEFGERAGMCFLVLEFVDGLNMRQALREGRIGPRDALRIVPQICDALQYAHEHGVVHRDIKPENVLIDALGRVKVTDFGLAKIVAGESSPQELTLTGQLMGTPHYMAPEQFERPTSVDHRADIYSLGVVFYEMLTGELPLGRFQPPSQMVQVDVRFDEVVLRSLEKAPERRWQHAADVKSEVGVISTTPATVPDPLRPNGLPRGVRMSRLAIGGALAGPLAAVIAVVCLLIGRTPGAWVEWLIGALIAAVVCLVAWAASLVAWVRIRDSEGRLRGLPYAIAGSIAPPVFALVATAATFLFVGVSPAPVAATRAVTVPAPAVTTPGPPRAPAVVGPGTGIVPPPNPSPATPRSSPYQASPRRDSLTVAGAVTDRVRTILWNPPRSVQEALAFHAKSDGVRLLEVADLEARGAEGKAGLPLLLRALPVEKTREYDIASVTPVGVSMAICTIDDRRRSIACFLKQDGGTWWFVGKPVVVDGPDPLADAPARRYAQTDDGILEPKTALARVSELWTDLLTTAQRGDLAHLEFAYTPATLEALRAAGPSLAQDGAAGIYGVPLVSDATLGVPLTTFRLTDVQVDARSRTAIGVATSAVTGTRLLFPLTCRGVSHWYFGAEPVTVDGVTRPASEIPARGLDTTARRAIDDLWNACRRGVRADDFADLLALYQPEDRQSLRGNDPDEMRKRPADFAGIGLPFWAVSRGKDSLDRLKLTLLEVTGGVAEPAAARRLEVRATASADDGTTARFDLVSRLVQEVQGPRLVWYFRRTPVEETKSPR